MAKAWLHDDRVCDLPAAAGQVPRAMVVLDDDRCVPESVPYTPPPGSGTEMPQQPNGPRQSVTVRARTRTGYDVDGNPMFDWATLVEGVAVWSEVRYEFDAVAGMTVVKASAMVEYEGPNLVFETAVVHRASDSTLWRVIATRQPYGRIEFDLVLIEQEPDEVSG